jgi:hypothetical protein
MVAVWAAEGSPLASVDQARNPANVFNAHISQPAAKANARGAIHMSADQRTMRRDLGIR